SLQEWIAKSLHSIPQQVQTWGERLRELQAEQRRLEEDIQRAPEVESIAHLHAEMERLRKSLVEVQKRLANLAEERGRVRFQREEQYRLCQQASAQLEAAALVERQMALATRSKIVLRTYQD